MAVADAWYTSGTFWAATGAVVTVLASAAVVRVTLVAGFPRRRLYYGLPAVTPIVSAPAGVRDGLEVRHHGRLLDDPYVLTIKLTSRGRKDIPSNAYDDDQPLELDVGSPIVEILQVVSEPKNLPQPKIINDGTRLKIGPSLLSRHHEITIHALTDGDPPSLSCSRNPFIDVQVRERLGDSPDRTLAAIAVAGGLTAVALAVTAEEFALRKSAGWSAVAAAGAAITALLVTMIVWPSRRRHRNTTATRGQQQAALAASTGPFRESAGEQEHTPIGERPRENGPGHGQLAAEADSDEREIEPDTPSDHRRVVLARQHLGIAGVSWRPYRR
jgi:hypothetical protein